MIEGATVQEEEVAGGAEVLPEVAAAGAGDEAGIGAGAGGEMIVDVILLEITAAAARKIGGQQTQRPQLPQWPQLPQRNLLRQ
mmetsp:Transcript_47267/g.76620  ORF Transcript_47267/g.76620 Transcript_47267/m.76620 type:complete len:83 (-) Transcript_47267:504-752(-)